MPTTNQESSNSVLEPGTIKLLGDRTMIRLQQATDQTVLPSGLVNPVFENYETDGGKASSRISNKHYLTIGVVLVTTSPDLKVGDTVTVMPSSANRNYFFPLDRSQLQPPFDGTILVPNSHIECKINN